MSNFQCPHCGMTNIDCGKDGYKTPREIELEEKLKKYEDRDLAIRILLKDCVDCNGDCSYCGVSGGVILNILNGKEQ